MTQAPLFFHISPDWCGEARLAQMFQLNGHEALDGERGALASEILFCEARDQTPLARWPRVRLFTGLYRTAPFWRPPLEAWRSFDFLRSRFPHAYFILTTREIDGWLVDRLTRANRAAARCYAHHRDVPEGDLPQIWEADWHAHLRAVEACFGADPRLIRIDLEAEDPQSVCRRLSALLPMDVAPPDRDWFPPADPWSGKAVMAAFETDASAAVPDPDYVEDVASFCLRGLSPDDSGRKGVSRHYCEWDGEGIILDHLDQTRQIAIRSLPGDPGRRNAAVSRPDQHFKLLRAEGVVNDALRLGRAMRLRIDMEDSRWMGSPQGQALGVPVLGHCRREGARNVVLWPLPDQHQIGMPGFDRAAAPDRLPFDDKLDRVVWRGMISGSEMRDGVRPGAGSHVHLARLAQAGQDPAARDAAWQDLCRTSRLNFVRRWFGHPDFNLGIVMAWSMRDLSEDPLLAPYCDTRRGPGFFRQFRYQLCLTGFDHGSNFIPMIDSQSVLLAEQDGWEVFYSGRFKPWKHFIPVARYCGDILEKLAWARENPNKCKEMSAAARAEVAMLRDAPTRRAILSRILDGLAASR